MRKKLFICSLLLLIAVGGLAQESGKGLYSIAFYNLENLFDTIHDYGKNDKEYLPDSRKGWNTEKYQAKLANMSRVLGEIARDKTPQGPAVIGVAEIENRRVLEDLVRQPAVASVGYGIVHHEGPDERGIDCALLYDPKQFVVTSSKLAPYIYLNNNANRKTRGFLIVRGELAGEDFCFIVNHWPSRAAESSARVRAAEQVAILKDSLMKENKKLKLVVMGDMNDDPMDESMSVALQARKYPKDVKRGEFYNPWWEILEDKGVGTLLYRGKWNLFDQIVVSKTLLKKKKLHYDSCEVFMREYLFQQDGRYKGAPFRTFVGNTWLNGYSDHLPTIIYMRNSI